MILQGWRNHHDKWWYLPLSVEYVDEKVGDNENNIVKNVYGKKQSELATFLHETFFSPVKSTLVKAVKNGNFVTWPARPHG